MSYTETLFLFGFALVALDAFLLRPWPIIRQWFLTIFSLLVILSFGVYSLALFAIVAVLNFVAAQFLASRVGIAAQVILGVAIICDLGALAFFKYSGFVDLYFGALGIPLAISFYTFHVISYLVDLYRGKTAALGFGRYLFYLSFFPHVVAGSIVRTWQLVPQLRFTRRIAADWSMGFHFLVTGFFLKSICADNIGAIIDPVWYASVRFSPADRWLAPLLYYCQIYGDFAGYSLMALGMARLLGFRLPANFRSPMRAASFQEFWHRWHITLSRWLRDYLYIPLGGSRSGITSLNLMLTMLLGGLWHGNAPGFVAWGFLHGAGLAIERVIPKVRGTRSWWIVTQASVALAWIPFRVPSWDAASDFVVELFSPATAKPAMTVAFALVFALPVIVHQFLPLLIDRIGHRKLPLYLGAMTGVLFVLDLTISTSGRVFLYFSF